jgi:hypothetical protein
VQLVYVQLGARAAGLRAAASRARYVQLVASPYVPNPLAAAAITERPAARNARCATAAESSCRVGGLGGRQKDYRRRRVLLPRTAF